MQFHLNELCGFKKGNHREKHICRSSLMQFHLGELCGFKKVTTKNTEKIIDKDRFLLIRLCVSVVSKRVTTKNTEKNTHVSCLMLFHLCVLRCAVKFFNML
jgi:hypothetical protein